MKFDHKFLAVVLALSLCAVSLVGIPVMAQPPIFDGDGVGNLAPLKGGKVINETLRTGIYGGDQVGNLGPAQGGAPCNMTPQQSVPCYANMPCGPNSQQCALYQNHKDHCNM